MTVTLVHMAGFMSVLVMAVKGAVLYGVELVVRLLPTGDA